MDTNAKIQNLLTAASDDTKAVIADVFKIEKEKLYMATPRGMGQELAKAIKDRIK